jgi:hypothetical protein
VVACRMSRERGPTRFSTDQAEVTSRMEARRRRAGGGGSRRCRARRTGCRSPRRTVAASRMIVTSASMPPRCVAELGVDAGSFRPSRVIRSDPLQGAQRPRARSLRISRRRSDRRWQPRPGAARCSRPTASNQPGLPSSSAFRTGDFARFEPTGDAPSPALEAVACPARLEDLVHWASPRAPG